jgi:hypothetical protein
MTPHTVDQRMALHRAELLVRNQTRAIQKSQADSVQILRFVPLAVAIILISTEIDCGGERRARHGPNTGMQEAAPPRPRSISTNSSFVHWHMPCLPRLNGFDGPDRRVEPSVNVERQQR